MKPDVFEAKMRKGEYFHNIRVPEGMWAVVRLDGRGFTKLTNAMKFEKPFDRMFSVHMINTVVACMEEFPGVFATTHSDEISIAFPPSFDLFDREVEKIVSTTAAVASVAFSGFIGQPTTFDSRIWIGASTEDVCDYFLWRQEDSVRGCINSYAYWMLRQRSNMTKKEATRKLLKQGFAAKNELLFTEFGINFNDTPPWQRRGTGFYYTLQNKEGFNPKTQQKTVTKRRVLQIDSDLPMKDEFPLWLRTNIDLLTIRPELKGCFSYKKYEDLQEV
jgi:tRNA(His) 5'-end guanylyltransferase